jgi:subtilisin family serine protease
MKSNQRRHFPRLYVQLFFVLICLVGLMQTGTTRSSSRSQSQNQLNKISAEVLSDTIDGKRTSVVILLADQADVSAAYAMTDQDARGWFVYNTLTQHAARTQVGLQTLLKAQGVSYQSFWAANMLVADADRSLVDQLAERGDVARVDSNKPRRWIEDPKIANFQVASKKPNTPQAAEWGVTNVNAPALWARGFTGQGIVVGDLDTGMRWTHNALKPKYRGWNGVTADHNFNWHDSIHSGGGSCGPNTVAPCDDSGHGTHTAGTMVGDDGAGDQVGVAPGAKWIGCRNMDQGNGTPATYTECFQFTIAPTDLAGNNANPGLRPHVLNNSWTCPASEGCTTRAELETIVNNTQAAGIFVEASAGNSGPGCSTVSDPPAIYSAAFSTGAIDISNTLAGFSSRGPSTYYTPALLKPNISAPGVNVSSSLRTSDSSFGPMSGTSMAGPHVVGVVALLWSARPTLVRNIAATKALLQNSANQAVTVTAQPCGGIPSTQIPNNSFGYGRVDALAAYNASAPTAGPATLSGQILDTQGQPVSGTTVTISGGAQIIRAITDSNGFYQVDNLTASVLYNVTPLRANYIFSPANRSFTLVADKTDAVFTAAPMAPNANPLESPEFFVRQQYVDVLGREPDQGGLDYWSAQLRNCGTDLNCVSTQRIGVSAAFFIAQEFQLTGSYIYDVYAGALGRKPLFNEYANDRQQVVGGANLDAARTAFAQSFVRRIEFMAKYQANTTAASFVDALIQNVQTSGVDLSAERTNLINSYNSAGNSDDSRAAVVRVVADNATFKQSQYNQAFVLTEYFSYLRRDPDQGGYNFWLNVLNTGDPGNYRGMVCSFITATEYQARFSPVVIHSNAECGQ